MTWRQWSIGKPALTGVVLVLVTMWQTPSPAADTPVPKANSTVGMARAPRAVSLVNQKVYFATNRRRTDTRSPSQQFTGDRAETVNFGSARVAMAASVEDDHLVMPETSAVHSLSWSELASRLAKASRVLIVIHGFNSTFEEAAVSAALLKRNLRTEAAVLMVSWPSQGQWASYLQDEEEADLSVGMLASVLADVAKALGPGRIQLFAHSLGSRLAVKALSRIFTSTRREILRSISQIVFAAPDVYRDLMDEEFLPMLEEQRIPTTIYVTDPDFWIGLSELLHRHLRVGGFWSRSVYLRPLITTIDVTAVDNTFTGHSVAFASPHVLLDLYLLLERELPPEQRPWLWKIDLANGSYWRLLPR